MNSLGPLQYTLDVDRDHGGHLPGRPKRILVVDDHPLICDALVRVLKQIFITADVTPIGSVSEAITRLDDSTDIDLLLLDLTLPGHHGLSALWTLREHHPTLPIVVFSAVSDPATIRLALASGARGFVPKQSGSDVLRQALVMIMDGGTFVPLDALTEIDGVLPPADQTDDPAEQPTKASFNPFGLPRRQREILELLGRGLSNKEICRRLDLSPNTVKTHLSIIFETLGVHSRYEIFALLQAPPRAPFMRAGGTFLAADRPISPASAIGHATVRRSN